MTFSVNLFKYNAGLTFRGNGASKKNDGVSEPRREPDKYSDPMDKLSAAFKLYWSYSLPSAFNEICIINSVKGQVQKVTSDYYSGKLDALNKKEVEQLIMGFLRGLPIDSDIEGIYLECDNHIAAENSDRERLQIDFSQLEPSYQTAMPGDEDLHTELEARRFLGGLVDVMNLQRDLVHIDDSAAEADQDFIKNVEDRYCNCMDARYADSIEKRNEIAIKSISKITRDYYKGILNTDPVTIDSLINIAFELADILDSKTRREIFNKAANLELAEQSTKPKLTPDFTTYEDFFDEAIDALMYGKKVEEEVSTPKSEPVQYLSFDPVALKALDKIAQERHKKDEHGESKEN